MKYLARYELLIAQYADAARVSSDAGRMQAAVDADSCAQGTCGHRTTERPVVMAGSIEQFN